MKRHAYDLRWPGIRDSLKTRQESEKRQAEAAQAEKKFAAKQKEEDAARQGRLRDLESARWRSSLVISGLEREVGNLKTELKRLKDLDDEDIRREKERNGWWAFLASPIYGREVDTEENKVERERGRLNRVASRSIKGSELAEKEGRVRKLKDALRDVDGRIAAERKKVDDEKRRVEEEARAMRMKMEQEVRDREMKEARERIVRAQKEWAERAAREMREAQAAREAQERARMAAEAERRRKEAEQLAQAKERAEEAARKAKKLQDKMAAKTAREARNRSGTTAKNSSCRHERYWTRIEGRQVCGNCSAVQSRFAFQCPGCKMMACANCRQSLRGEKRKHGGIPRRQSGFAGNDDHDYDHPFYDYD